ncbi:cell division protein FtsX, partial [Parapusillimonas sp. SGNA-6]|nr:cell division protein FtsX [Parapusillimonas sp. SGNA-6]
IIHGLIGALIAILLLIFALQFAQKQVPELIFLRNWYEFGAIFIIVVILGILISGLSTYFAVTKYLKAKSHSLYR